MFKSSHWLAMLGPTGLAFASTPISLSANPDTVSGYISLGTD